MTPDLASEASGQGGDGKIGGISLIVPVRDEADSLAVLLVSIQRQTRLPEQVLLVDGASSDETVALARRLVGSDPRFRIIEAGDATPGRGRNVGIEAASFDWVALTDAGIELDHHWLQRLEEVAIAHPAASVVWGTYEPRITSFLDSCAAIAYVPPRRQTPSGPARGPCIASCLLRKSAWHAAGGFPDLRAAEDLIFMERMELAGVQEAWAPDASVCWSLPPSIGQTFRRFRSYSRHNVLAGRQSGWHYGVARMYLAAGALILATRVVNCKPLPLLGAAAATRIAKCILKHRDGRSLGWLLNPARFLGVGAVLIAVDAATFGGWADGAREQFRQLKRPREAKIGNRAGRGGPVSVNLW